MSVTSTDVPVDCDAGHGNDTVNARDVCDVYDVCHDLYTVMTRDQRWAPANLFLVR
jgi:hypothetical protein